MGRPPGPAREQRPTALIDRLVHHSEIIGIEGESHRKRKAEMTKEATGNRTPQEVG
ncbi:MAG TPA: ATP-binding protein [Anaeromyxobacter sp.]|nr:ATP-binding protein [Anaeromyxobacter sp.]